MAEVLVGGASVRVKPPDEGDEGATARFVEEVDGVIPPDLGCDSSPSGTAAILDLLGWRTSSSSFEGEDLGTAADCVRVRPVTDLRLPASIVSVLPVLGGDNEPSASLPLVRLLSTLVELRVGASPVLADVDEDLVNVRGVTLGSVGEAG